MESPKHMRAGQWRIEERLVQPRSDLFSAAGARAAGAAVAYRYLMSVFAFTGEDV
jgi:hypothetical protein